MNIRTFMKCRVKSVWLLFLLPLLMLALPAEANHYPSVVNAEVSVASVNEDGSTTVQLKIRNTASITQSYPLTWTISGSATNGLDYNSIPTSGTVTAPSAYQTVVVQTVTLKDDALLEGPETIIFNISGYPNKVNAAIPTATSTIIDDEAPAINISATTPSAVESGGTPGTVTLTRGGGTNDDIAQTTVGFTASGTATDAIDYDVTLAGVAGSVGDTAYADFNQGDVSAVTVNTGGTIALGIASVVPDLTLPDAGNIQAAVSMGLGATANDRGRSPVIKALPGGGYRYYYSLYNGTNWILYYRDTTDNSLPNEVNLGAIQDLGLSTSATDQSVYLSDVIQLAGGGYRIYYSYLASTPTYWRLAYRDTTDASLPTASNLGVQQLVGTGVTNHTFFANVQPLAGGSYRLYYADNTNAYYQIVYQDTTDTNPPGTANLGTKTLVMGTGTTDQILMASMVPGGAGGGYRVYYSLNNGTFRQLAYRDTTDTNLPSAANLGAQQLLGVGTSATDQGLEPVAVQDADGSYRLYYAAGQYGILSYRDTPDITAYAAASTYTSAVQLAAYVHSGFSTLDYSATTPAGTTVTVDARSGNTVTPDGSWTAWQLGVADLGDITALGSNTYAQYRVNLATTDTSITPLLDDIDLNFDFDPAQAATIDATATQTSDADFNAGDVTNNALVLNNSVQLSENGVFQAAVETSAADFNSADTMTNTAVAGESVTILPVVVSNIDAGTGADGAYSCLSGTCALAGATYNFTTVDIAAGATVNVTGTTALLIKATGAVNIAGTINANGSNGQNGGVNGSNPQGGIAGSGGFAGGASCANGAGTGNGKAPAGSHDGAGGAGYGTAGATGAIGYEGSPGAGGTTYGDAAITTLQGGSGGGGAATMSYGCNGSAGGGGGGAIQIQTSDNIALSGLISVNGGAGGNNTTDSSGMGGGAGGGSGGAVKLIAAVIDMNGAGTLIAAAGGVGGNSSYGNGGAGGVGRIRLQDADGIIAAAGLTSPAASVIADDSVDLVYNTDPGIYTSDVLDTGNTKLYFTKLDFTADIPLNTTLTVDVRAGNTVTPDGTWTAWQTGLADGADLSALGTNQYVQYRANFATTDTATSPRLDDISIGYVEDVATFGDTTGEIMTYDSSGSFVSSVMDFGTHIGFISINNASTVPTSTTLSIDVRAGDAAVPDGSWTAWSALDALGDIGLLRQAQYLQYRINMATTDELVTPSLDSLSVSYATSYIDIFSAGQVIFPRSGTSITLDIVPLDDVVDEYNETAILTLGGGLYSIGASPATVTILDDDLNQVSIAAAGDAAELGGAAGSWTVTRTGILDAALTVNYVIGGAATNGTDYGVLSGSVTLPAGSGIGSNSATISTVPVNDALVEGDEDIALTLSADATYSLGATTVASIDIIDNDTGGTRIDTTGSVAQTDWAGVKPADDVSCTVFGGTWTGSDCIATHDANQANWNVIDSTTAGLDLSAAQVAMVSSSDQWLQTDDSTSDTGFNHAGSTFSGSATILGTDIFSSISLAPIDVGTGVDGVFDSSVYNGSDIVGITGTSPTITINTDEATHLGVYNFTDFAVAAGDTVIVSGANPLVLNVQKAVLVTGVLNAGGRGIEPGPAGGRGGAGGYPSGTNGVGAGPLGVGGGIAAARNFGGSGGAGHAANGAGGSGFDYRAWGNYVASNGTGGAAYGDAAMTTLYAGSGGGGPYNTYNPTDYGGGGGGIVVINAGSVAVLGTVSVAGAKGTDYWYCGNQNSCGRAYAGGGGSGGSLKISSANISLADGGTRLSALGGAGGKNASGTDGAVISSGSGGAGAGGRIVLETHSSVGTANVASGSFLMRLPSTTFVLPSSGSYTSGVKFAGFVNGINSGPSVWGAINWTESVPVGTTLTLSVRSCAAADCSDRATIDWSQPITGQDLSLLTFVDDSHSYIQYKVDLTTDGDLLPQLYDLTIDTISYGSASWLQTDSSTNRSGFNLAGSVTNNTVVVGDGNAAGIILEGVAGNGVDGVFDAKTYDGSSIAGITGTKPTITIDTNNATNGGVYNFTQFNIPAGVTVRAQGVNPLQLYVTGNATVNGVIDARGFNGGAGGPGGSAGGAGCTAGSGLGAGAGANDEESIGGGGGSYGTAAADGEESYNVAGALGGTAVYGDDAISGLEGGSGGGGVATVSTGCGYGAKGGGGGGVVSIKSGNSITVGKVGRITVDGGVGGDKPQSDFRSGGGAGGGSGGSIKLYAGNITLNNAAESLSAAGGLGGESYYYGNGGAGGNGRIRLDANVVTGDANIGSGVTFIATPISAATVNGTYTSAIYDVGSTTVWHTIDWQANLPQDTAIVVSVRSCAVADCTDRGANDWSVADNAQDISSLTFVDDGHRYIQYKVEMSSTIGLVPFFEMISISMVPNQENSTLVSSVFDSQDSINEITELAWTATTPAGTSVNLQLRTSPDGVAWTSWYGPTSDTDYYTTSGSVINGLHADGVNDRYFQYRAILMSNNVEFTPVLEDVTVSYISFGAVIVGAVSEASSSGGGGGAMGWISLLLLVVIPLLIKRSRRNENVCHAVKAPNVGYSRYMAILLMTAASSPAVYADQAINANAEAGFDPNGQYRFFSVGDPNSGFYQEFIIQASSSYGTFQGDVSTASLGAGNRYDPLSLDDSVSGNGSANPKRIIMWQMNRDDDMSLDFLKDNFSAKPRIMQTVLSGDMLKLEFMLDMRNSDYLTNSTAAGVVNTLELSDPGFDEVPTNSASTINKTPGSWDISLDSENSTVTAGQYTYAESGRASGAGGVYNYTDGTYNAADVDWGSYFDPTDPSNVWSDSTNKPQ